MTDNIIDILEMEIERLKTIDVRSVRFQTKRGRVPHYGNENNFEPLLGWINDVVELPLLSIFCVNVSDIELLIKVNFYKDEETRTISVQPRSCKLSSVNKKHLINFLVPHISNGWEFV